MNFTRSWKTQKYHLSVISFDDSKAIKKPHKNTGSTVCRYTVHSCNSHNLYFFMEPVVMPTARQIVTHLFKGIITKTYHTLTHLSDKGCADTHTTCMLSLLCSVQPLSRYVIFTMVLFTTRNQTVYLFSLR